MPENDQRTDQTGKAQMIDRYDLIYRFDQDAEMRKVLFPAPTEGEWVKYDDHVAETLAMRDKLLELAKECSACSGTGVISVRPQDEAVWGRELPCDACEDIRELLA
jgi:hypothetical protein